MRGLKTPSPAGAYALSHIVEQKVRQTRIMLLQAVLISSAMLAIAACVLNSIAQPFQG